MEVYQGTSAPAIQSVALISLKIQETPDQILSGPEVNYTSHGYMMRLRQLGNPV
jgi:hypothetical protein